MGTRKTDAEIKTEIATLEMMRGNDHINVDQLNAQIRVLEKRMSHDDLFDKWGPETDDHDDEVFHAALDTYNWMKGDAKESPSQSWE